MELEVSLPCAQESALDPVHRQMNFINIPQPCFFKVYLSIILSHTSTFLRRPLSFGFSRPKLCMHFWSLRCVIRAHLMGLDLITLTMFREEHKLWSPWSYTFLQPRVTSSQVQIHSSYNTARLREAWVWSGAVRSLSLYCLSIRLERLK
jgi:hypothetical protein